MKILLLIGAGSFIGGVFRHLISVPINRQMQHFAPGTLLVNIFGCLFIGFLVGLLEKEALSSSWSPFLITGVLGGFTTFSAFSLETIHLIKEGLIFNALLYVGLSVILGLAATAAGFFLIKFLQI